MNQKNRVLHYLRKAGKDGIHSFELVKKCDTFRVAARILDLKHDGYDIESRPEKLNGILGVRYTLHEEIQPKKEWSFEGGVAKQI